MVHAPSPTSAEPTLRTAIPAIDELTTVVRARRLTRVGGTPGTGRTALVRSIATGIAQGGHAVALLLPDHDPTDHERAALALARPCKGNLDLLRGIHEAAELGVRALVLDHVDRVSTDLHAALGLLHEAAQLFDMAVVVGSWRIPDTERCLGDTLLSVDDHDLEDFGFESDQVLVHRDPDTPTEEGPVMMPRPRVADASSSPAPAVEPPPQCSPQPQRSPDMHITTRPVYEHGQRIGWCARPLGASGHLDHAEVHALVTDTALEYVGFGPELRIPRARIDDIPALRELWRTDAVEWIGKSVFTEIDDDDDDDELEVIVHPSPRRVGPAAEHAQLVDSERRLVASAVRLPAGTEALVMRGHAYVAPDGIDRQRLERIALRRRLPPGWVHLGEEETRFLCEVVSLMGAAEGEGG